jgi:hypothetical protein
MLLMVLLVSDSGQRLGVFLLQVVVVRAALVMVEVCLMARNLVEEILDME